uniref:Chromosome transmission fidelity protein 8 n=1 Tax=Hemiselmis andersenii TaxID=464988 RepID=A0A7S1MTE7_HEMAN
MVVMAGEGAGGQCKQMLIKVAEDGPKEWTAIELQGLMEPREGESLGGLPLGELARKGDKGVSLTVGNQRLDGKVVELGEPLAVMEKRQGEGAAAGEYLVVGWVRRKVVFMHRPTVVTQSYTSPMKDIGTQEVS